MLTGTWSPSTSCASIFKLAKSYPCWMLVKYDLNTHILLLKHTNFWDLFKPQIMMLECASASAATFFFAAHFFWAQSRRSTVAFHPFMSGAKKTLRTAIIVHFLKSQSFRSCGQLMGENTDSRVAWLKRLDYTHVLVLSVVKYLASPPSTSFFFTQLCYWPDKKVYFFYYPLYAQKLADRGQHLRKAWLSFHVWPS